MELKNILESLLFSAQKPLSTKELRDVLAAAAGAEEADAAAGKISTSSPIGRALLGKAVGDEVKVTIPGGVKELEILKLTTVYEAAD